MIASLLLLLFLLAALALVWWGVSRFALPEPVKTVVLMVVGLLALLALYKVVVGSGLI